MEDFTKDEKQEEIKADKSTLDYVPPTKDESYNDGGDDQPQEEEMFASNTIPGQKQRRRMKQQGPRYPQQQPKIASKLQQPPMAASIAAMQGIDLKNRPAVASYELDGSRLRRDRAISLNISEKLLPPYTKGANAIYRALNGSTVDIYLEGTYQFHDKWEKDPLLKQKLMQNIGRTTVVIDPNTKKEKLDYVIRPVDLVNGVKHVNVEADYREYVFMELHPLNKSNPHRRMDIEPMFERVDLRANKSAAMTTAMMDLALSAENEIINRVTTEDLIKGYAVSFGIPTENRWPSDVKAELRIAARNNPMKFFNMSPNMAVAIETNVHTAMSHGLIEYSAQNRRFTFTENDEEFHTHIVGEDPIKSLVSAISVEGSNKYNLYQEMVGMLNYWVE